MGFKSFTQSGYIDLKDGGGYIAGCSWWTNSKKPGFWTVSSIFFGSCLAVVDDFGNLVMVPS
jgi:hypothetical protein